MHRPRPQDCGAAEGPGRVPTCLPQGRCYPYLLERIGPARTSVMAGSGEWAKTGSPYFSSYPTDGYTDLVRIRPPDYCLGTGFWSGDGWYGDNVDINHNVVVAGQNIVAAEAVVAPLMGYNPRDLQQMYLARDVGLGSYEESDYTVVGGDPAQLEYYFPGNSNFKPSGFQEWAMLGPFGESDITVYLRFGSDGGARVWVNGTQILDVPAGAYAHRSPAVSLVQGSNHMLVKTVGSAGGGGFALSLTDGTRMLTEVRPLVPPAPSEAPAGGLACPAISPPSPGRVPPWT